MTSKILALTDALGNLVRFVLLPGNCADISGVRELLAGQKFGYLLADRGFDADWLRRELANIKEFRGIATRSCKTDSSFAAFICLASTLINSR